MAVECHPCPSGQGYSEGCIKCPDGMITNQLNLCEPCPDNQMHEVGQLSCRPCKPGHECIILPDGSKVENICQENTFLDIVNGMHTDRNIFFT